MRGVRSSSGSTSGSSRLRDSPAVVTYFVTWSFSETTDAATGGLIGSVIGSAFGLVFNWFGNRWLVFRRNHIVGIGAVQELAGVTGGLLGNAMSSGVPVAMTSRRRRRLRVRGR